MGLHVGEPTSRSLKPDPPVLRQSLHRHRPVHGLQASDRHNSRSATRTGFTCIRRKNLPFFGFQHLRRPGGRWRRNLLFHQSDFSSAVRSNISCPLGVQAPDPRSNVVCRRDHERGAALGLVVFVELERTVARTPDNIFMVKLHLLVLPVATSGSDARQGRGRIVIWGSANAECGS